MRARKCNDREGHLLSGDGKGRDLSGQRKKLAERGALTSWRRQREGLVRAREQTDRPRHTHILETAKRGPCQDMEKNRPIEAHSLPGDGRERDLSDLETNRLTEAHSHAGNERGRDLSGHGKKSTDRGTLTHWRQQREALVRTRKQTDRPRRTHPLETADGGTCQDTERNQPTEAHSHSGDGRARYLSGHGKRPTDRGALTHCRGRHLSGYGKKQTDRGALTCWRWQREGLCQNSEINRPTEAHSLAEDGRKRDLSGLGNKLTD